MIDLEVEVSQPQKVINDEEKLLNEMLKTYALTLLGNILKLEFKEQMLPQWQKAGKNIEK